MTIPTLTPTTNDSDSSIESTATIKDVRRGRPLLASIGTVLIDSFEIPPRPNLDVNLTTFPPSKTPHPQVSTDPRPESQSSDCDPVPASPLPAPSPAEGSTSRPSTSSSSSSAIHRRLSDISGRSTPQRNFDSPIASPADDVWEVLGGGGMYALIGARMWLDPSDLRCMVDRACEKRGRDFPKMLEDQLNVFGEEIWCWNEGPETQATKSRLKYVDGIRYFEYIDPPPHRSIQSLADTPVFGSEYLHISPPYTPEETVIILEDLRTVTSINGEEWRPKVIYEPHPRTCEPSQRSWLERAAPSVHILSPNHEELLAIYGETSPVSSLAEIQQALTPLIEHLVNVIGVGGGHGAVVIRCGRHGSCVGTRARGIKWYPAFFTEEDAGRVIDVSGAGNSYLGGFAAGLHISGGDPYEAALYATVTSSFMVEQIGLPRLDTSSGEMWNGESPQTRLEMFKKRVQEADSLIESRNEIEEVKM